MATLGSEDGERIVACRYGTAGEETTETELGTTLYLSYLAAGVGDVSIKLGLHGFAEEIKGEHGEPMVN